MNVLSRAATSEESVSVAARLLDMLSNPHRIQVLYTVDKAERLGTRCTVAYLSQELSVPIRSLMKDVTRLQLAGVLRGVDADQLTVNYQRVSDASVDLVDSLPISRIAEEHGAAQFFRYGRLARIPDDWNDQNHLARALIELIPEGEEVSESTINYKLSTVSSDFASLRRLLVDHGLLMRDPTGATYSRGCEF